MINIYRYALVWTHPLILGKTGIVHCKHWRLEYPGEYQYSQGISSELINTHFFKYFNFAFFFFFLSLYCHMGIYERQVLVDFFLASFFFYYFFFKFRSINFIHFFFLLLFLFNKKYPREVTQYLDQTITILIIM